jgi:hypothetical protein
MIKKMLEKVKYVAGVSLLATSLIFFPPSNAIANEETNIKPFTELGLEFQISKPMKGVKNVPERMRYVPVDCKDPGYESSNGVINGDSASIGYLVDLRFLKAGLEKRLENKTFIRIYGDLSLNINYFGNRADHERNYMGDPGSESRGYGTALTYWGIKYGLLFIPGIKTDINIPIGNSKKDFFVIGGGIRQYKFQVENGWDRYNYLEKHQEYDIGKITEKSCYIGYREREKDLGFSILAGYNFYDFKQEDKDIQVNLNKRGFFINFGYPFKNDK